MRFISSTLLFRLPPSFYYTTVNCVRFYMFVDLLPKIRLSTKSTRKIKNKIFAILAAPEAIPPKPKMAAMMATIKKIIVQRNITFSLKVNKYLEHLRRKMCHILKSGYRKGWNSPVIVEFAESLPQFVLQDKLKRAGNGWDCL